jgi:hypothetical protein
MGHVAVTGNNCASVASFGAAMVDRSRPPGTRLRRPSGSRVQGYGWAFTYRGDRRPSTTAAAGIPGFDEGPRRSGTAAPENGGGTVAQPRPIEGW